MGFKGDDMRGAMQALVADGRFVEIPYKSMLRYEESMLRYEGVQDNRVVELYKTVVRVGYTIRDTLDVFRIQDVQELVAGKYALYVLLEDGRYRTY